MSVKQWFRELQPLPLYLMMGLTILFFVIELIASHFTHALTLLIDSYHTLCNLIALSGCLITVKVCKKRFKNSRGGRKNSEFPPGLKKGSNICNPRATNAFGLHR